MGLASRELLTPCVPKGSGLATGIKNGDDGGGGVGGGSSGGNGVRMVIVMMKTDMCSHEGLLHQAP